MLNVEVDLQRNKTLGRVSALVLAGNIFLGVLKVGAGLVFQSLSILGDGMDSMGDVLATITTLVAVGIMSRPPDKDHPWGHNRADTIATKFLTFVMFFFGAQLFARSLEILLQPHVYTVPNSWGLVLVGFSVIGKMFLSHVLSKIGKKTGSTMLVTNALNMRNDVILSISVLVGVGLSIFFGYGMIDVVTALLVSLWIMAGAVRSFNSTNLELMDGLKDTGLYQKVFSAVDGIEGANNPHRVRIRRFADRFLIDLDVEMESTLSLKEAHALGERVEAEIRKAIPEVYDIMLHIEPRGNRESERFGLKRGDV